MQIIAAIIKGIKILKILPANDKPCSVVATTGLPTPAVATLEVALVNAVPACTMPALPPPTIIPVTRSGEPKPPPPRVPLRLA